MIKNCNKIFLSLVALLYSASSFSQSALVVDGAFMVMSGGTKTTPIYLEVDDKATTAIENKIPGTGGIVSEGEFNQVKWEIQNNTGSFVVPFQNSSSNYIPVTMNITGAGVGAGSIKFATYGDLGWDNYTYKPSDVTNMQGACLNDDSRFVVDRFWIIDTGSAPGIAGYAVKPGANMTFTYTGSELNAPNNITEAKLVVQTFNSVDSNWWNKNGLAGTDNSTTKTVSSGNISPSDLSRSWNLVSLQDSVTSLGQSVSCGDSMITVTTTYKNAVSYSWSTGATASSISFVPAGTIVETDSVNFGKGCIIDTSVNITIQPVPVPVISGPQTICNGNSVPLSASGGTTYTWLPVSGLSSTTIPDPNASPVVTTIYTVSVANGVCTASANVTVEVNYPPTVSVSSYTTIVEGESTPIQAASGAGARYLWIPSNGLSCDTCSNPIATPSVSTWYHVTVSNSSGCTVNDSVLIDVKENCAGPVYVPNAFSPNGDGLNDVFKVMGKCLQGMELIVYDRWGNAVFETTNPAAGWDGTFKGKPMNTSTFVYSLEYTDANNNAVSKKGSVTLVR